MRYLFYLFLFANFSAHAQALRDINYKYLYNPNEPLHFTLKTVQHQDGWNTFYQLELRDTTAKTQDFWIQWELRSSLNEKEGRIIKADSVFKNINTSNILTGNIILNKSSATQILVAKVINNAIKRAWMFYQIIDPNYPVNGYLTEKNNPVFTGFIKQNSRVSITGNDSIKIISYYDDNFPAATPIFSETLGRVSKGLAVDSTFRVNTNQPVAFSKKGLYLVQTDTNAIEGFSFRVEDDYPRLAKLENLADPLIYICTKQEFDRIKLAKGDKRAFDRVILSVTGDAGRAKIFIRSYFRRIELANEFFTSYKEGWKTDRGMIYTIFGLPDEVFKFADREVWNYKNSSFKIDFEFVKSSTVFDPDNYVLIRHKKYQETWYEVIDLWRNARF